MIRHNPSPTEVRRTVDVGADPVAAHHEAQVAALEAEVAKLKGQLEDAKSALKARLRELAPDATHIDTTGGVRPRRLAQVRSWRVDNQRLQREYPEAYVLCGGYRTSWRLDARED